MDDPLIKIGKITKPHGLTAGLRVQMLTGDPEHFQPGSELLVEIPGQKPEECTVTKLKAVKKVLIVFIEGLEDYDEAQKYRKGHFLLPRSRLIPPEENEYFVFDLMGMKVVTSDGQEIGTISEVITSGPQDIYEVKVPGRKNAFLIPACRQFVKKVDLKTKTVTIEPMEGLLEI